MIHWPCFVDQQVNSRYVGEASKFGLDMKDTCDRVIVEKMIRELMELKKDEFLERTAKMSGLGKASVNEVIERAAKVKPIIPNNMANQTALYPPHVLIFPLPIQGPVTCMLKLAELFYLKNVQVTFLNTQHIQQRFRSCTDNENYFKKYPNFRFETVPDGLPEENPRMGDQIPNLLESMEAVAMPIIVKMVSCGGMYGPDSDKPITCIIGDEVFIFATHVAKEIGVQLLYFDTIVAFGVICVCLNSFKLGSFVSKVCFNY
ncbi:hypothetical protein BUALT_Bualt06G0050500 [Buddleja alternifolia]|uniref:Uncharacterized protein n=1 Tax=Buddleja alternifolia TaxID=168488 RepID=A0AAV6XE66_9LAMI|nr:hypothetical protein BUALT_Bualt06G0050500 [Buddleja alternifolia]